MSKTRQSTYLILIGLSAMYIFSLFVQTEENPCASHHYLLEAEIEGKIVQKYIIKRRQFKGATQKDTVIVLDNEKTVSNEGQGFYNAIYTLADSNDLLVKKRSSDTYFLYRNERLISSYRQIYNCLE